MLCSSWNRCSSFCLHRLRVEKGCPHLPHNVQTLLPALLLQCPGILATAHLTKQTGVASKAVLTVTYLAMGSSKRYPLQCWQDGRKISWTEVEVNTAILQPCDLQKLHILPESLASSLKCPPMGTVSEEEHIRFLHTLTTPEPHLHASCPSGKSGSIFRHPCTVLCTSACYIHAQEDC